MRKLRKDTAEEDGTYAPNEEILMLGSDNSPHMISRILQETDTEQECHGALNYDRGTRPEEPIYSSSKKR